MGTVLSKEQTDASTRLKYDTFSNTWSSREEDSVQKMDSAENLERNKICKSSSLID